MTFQGQRLFSFYFDPSISLCTHDGEAGSSAKDQENVEYSNVGELFLYFLISLPVRIMKRKDARAMQSFRISHGNSVVLADVVQVVMDVRFHMRK